MQMYLFEHYEDAVSYCLENPVLLPVFDGKVFGIGTMRSFLRSKTESILLSIFVIMIYLPRADFNL